MVCIVNRLEGSVNCSIEPSLTYSMCDDAIITNEILKNVVIVARAKEER